MMDEFSEGDQVVFNTGNEYLIGKFLGYHDTDLTIAIIAEGGKFWFIDISGVYLPSDIMDEDDD